MLRTAASRVVSRSRAVGHVRSVHATAPARSNPTGDNWHLPFKQYPNTSKPAFAVKLIAFTTIPFSIPFIASYWQLHKEK